MKEKSRFLGVDVHAETIAAAIAEPDGKVRSHGTMKAGDRMKTDRRDSERLARRYRSGDLTAVWVSDEAAHWCALVFHLLK